MHQTKFALAVLSAAVLAGCGGSPTGGNQTLKTTFSSQVTFGDSLSDVGTYAVGTVAALGGGKYTINGNNTAINPTLTGKNWTELVAAQLSLPAPCAAQTGLNGVAAQGFSIPVVNHAGCYGYAQGGARVTNPIGPGNIATGAAIGQLTVPVATQIQNHLAIVGGSFKGTELVIVMAGGNDVLYQLGALSAGATAAGTAAGNAAGAQVGATTFATELVGFLAAGATNPATAAQAIGAAVAAASSVPGATSTSIVTAAVGTAAIQPGDSAVASPAVYGPMVAKAQADANTAGAAAGATAGAAAGATYFANTAPSLVAAMAQAGTDLVTQVKTQIEAKGANYIVVNNLPDVATSPSGLAADTNTQALINSMVTAFNTALSSGLSGDPKILLVDVFARSHDQAVNPGQYSLSNVTTPACDLTPAKNPLGSSLVCNGSNLIAGDVSHYAFADTVHPTPYNHWLLAKFVSEQMVAKGWL